MISMCREVRPSVEKVQAAEHLEHKSDAPWLKYTRKRTAVKHQQNRFAPLQTNDPDEVDCKAAGESIQAIQSENMTEGLNTAKRVRGQKTKLMGILAKRWATRSDLGVFDVPHFEMLLAPKT